MRLVRPRVIEAREMLNESEIADLLKEATRRSLRRELLVEIRIMHGGTGRDTEKKQTWHRSPESAHAQYLRRVARQKESRQAAARQRCEAAE